MDSDDGNRFVSPKSDEEHDENNDFFTMDSDDDCIDTDYESDDKFKFVYKILTPDEVLKNIDDTIAEINSAIQLPITTIRTLLHHLKWNREGLMDRLFGDDPDKLFREINIPNPFTASPSRVAKKKKLDGEDPNECEVCCHFFLGSEFIGLECGHRFCYDCWNRHIKSKILDEGTDRITCLQYVCDTLMDQKQCLEILQDSRARKIYKRLITSSFVECNLCLIWCPNPNCEMVIQVDYIQATEPITCSCHFSFCCNCLKDWHSPLNCDLLRKWLTKCEDDSETRHWMKANSKKCPKCKNRIEKNGGCNHMTCKNIRCRYEFCWICLTNWEPDFYETHRCLDGNNPEPEEKGNKKNPSKRAKEALDWYLLHNEMYLSHKQSLKLEEKLVANVKVKIKTLIKNGVNMVEAIALDEGVTSLRRCRKTLMYTYPFAYFLNKEHNQTVIFKNNQADLQRATENLSGCLEREIPEASFSTLRTKLLRLCQYCRERCQALEEHVREGYTGFEGIKDTQWKFTKNALK